MGREATRTTGYGTWTGVSRTAGGGCGAITIGSWPRRSRWSAVRTTELATPFTSGRNDSVTRATRMQSRWARIDGQHTVRVVAGSLTLIERTTRPRARWVSSVRETSVDGRGTERAAARRRLRLAGW